MTLSLPPASRARSTSRRQASVEDFSGRGHARSSRREPSPSARRSRAAAGRRPRGVRALQLDLDEGAARRERARRARGARDGARPPPARSRRRRPATAPSSGRGSGVRAGRRGGGRRRASRRRAPSEARARGVHATVIVVAIPRSFGSALARAIRASRTCWKRRSMRWSTSSASASSSRMIQSGVSRTRSTSAWTAVRLAISPAPIRPTPSATSSR